MFPIWGKEKPPRRRVRPAAVSICILQFCLCPRLYEVKVYCRRWESTTSRWLPPKRGRAMLSSSNVSGVNQPGSFSPLRDPQQPLGGSKAIVSTSSSTEVCCLNWEGQFHRLPVCSSCPEGQECGVVPLGMVVGQVIQT